MKTLRSVGQPLLLAIVLALAARAAVRLYSIPSSSMEPTLRAGDHILVTPYHHALPQRGDVVVFHSPVDGHEVLIKRIVAVPGDVLESSAGRVVICGRTIAEPYLLRPATTGAIQTEVIPADSYFVLGDNRANSFDSRSWGILPRTLIIGRARLVLWSSGSTSRSAQAGAAQLSRAAAPGGLNFGRLFRRIE